MCLRGSMHRFLNLALITIVLTASLALAQTIAAPGQSTYQPQFKGDPAKSAAEAQTLGYMRTVIRAQKAYKKKRGDYAASLMSLAGHGSFTKRMARSTDRGDYSLHFRRTKDGYELSAIPQEYGPDHRAFF